MLPIKITFEFSSSPVSVYMDENDAFELLKSILIKETKLSSSASSVDSIPNPDTHDLTKYIKSKENYAFTIEEIIDSYLAEYENIDKNEKNRWINALRSKLNRIRDKIANEENGEWKEKKEDNNKLYYFIKNDTSDIKTWI